MNSKQGPSSHRSYKPKSSPYKKRVGHGGFNSSRGDRYHANPLKEALRKMDDESTPTKQVSADKKISSFRPTAIRKRVLSIEVPALPKNNRNERRIGRMLAAQILFAYESRNGQITEDEWPYFWECDWENHTDGAKLFAKTLVEGVIQHQEEIDELIKPKLVNWDFDRIAIINKAILRLSIFQLLSMQSIPDVVTINEGVDLAKLFSLDDDYKFINAVLDRLASEINHLKKSDPSEGVEKQEDS